MTNKEKNFISAVIYVHNSEYRVSNFINSIMSVLKNNFEHSEVICVNDCSTDNSLERIREIIIDPSMISLSVINLSYYHGVEIAMNAGKDIAIGDFVFEFDDTTLDFDLETIMEVYRKALEGNDIVNASPNKRLKFSSLLFYKTFDKFSRVPCHMTSERFRILSRRVINRINSMNNSTLYRKAVYANCGLQTADLKYNISSENKGKKDREERKYRSRLAVDSLILFTQVGYRFSMAMTFLMMFLSAIFLVYTLFVYFTAHPVAGWTTTVLFLSMAFLGLFGILTIVVKYLQLLVDMMFRKMHYSFESVEKITN